MKGECVCCGYTPVEVKTYKLNSYGDADLCELCAITLASSAMEYPAQYQYSGEALKTICHVGNAILDAIKSMGNEPTSEKGS